MTEYRPISLCNVIYKIGYKATANRIKKVLSDIISPTKSAFVPQRLITDNVLVAYEINHSIKTNSRKRSNLMAMKLDIISYACLFNGSECGSVVHSRGLRQGDPLSPYLLILCTEALIAMVQLVTESGRLQGFRVAPTAPMVSSLCLADDTLFFCQANEDNVGKIRQILHQYARVSGQNSQNISKAGKEILIKAVGVAWIKRRIRLHGRNYVNRRKIMGMRFRDLRSFNLTLYHNGDFWAAVVGHRPSATWRAIVEACGHLKEGVRMRIGDGTNTSVWCDPWILHDNYPKLITPRPVHSAFPNSVADLIDRNTGSWKIEVLDNIFWLVDKQCIFTTPIGGAGTADRIIWGFSNLGNFTVKSCYHNIVSRHSLRVGDVLVGSNTGSHSYNWK
ncbi:PREDICTED: uncharacterized protein LOC105972874 [Erythranthe guttata]|uniref:uncharacterized protein LOC105972874 n=1 Tax=Erythranthe guttata TaxID=4155 RepID=UPI00064DABAA|nr:PREDICTED: uncharacterized protein LOC105972874 [Erythranthe guttata]|eukprot:XP_012853309.1 PREDICTED: uncharacterized protein LOC105972874 [Erythranthe guttata]